MRVRMASKRRVWRAWDSEVELGGEGCLVDWKRLLRGCGVVRMRRVWIGVVGFEGREWVERKRVCRSQRAWMVDDILDALCLIVTWISENARFVGVNF